MSLWDPDTGYDLDDPKHPTFADRVFEQADSDRKRAREDAYGGDGDPEDGIDPCAHDCGNAATVAHADGRLLCRPCYDVETTSGPGVSGCPTCHPEEVA